MRYYRAANEFPRECATNDVFSGLMAIIQIQEQIMAAIDDLTKAVADAVTAINDLRTQLANVPPPGNGVTDAQLEGLASQLEAAVTPAPAAPAPETAAPAA